MTKAPRFPDPALQAIADEFAEVLRVKLNAEEKLDELFDTIAEELVGYEQRFSDQEIRAITEGIEAMRAMVATRAKPAGGYAGPTAPTGATAAEIPIPPGAISRRDRALGALLDEDGQWLRALLDEDRQWLQAPPERRPWWRRIVG
jgi:hypothetical protein